MCSAVVWCVLYVALLILFVFVPLSMLLKLLLLSDALLHDRINTTTVVLLEVRESCTCCDLHVAWSSWVEVSSLGHCVGLLSKSGHRVCLQAAFPTELSC